MGSRNANLSDFDAVMKFLGKNLIISKIVTPEESPIAVKQWADSPGSVVKILVRF